MNFERIKKNYDSQLWSAVMVRECVFKAVITPAQYEEITGLKFYVEVKEEEKNV